MNETSSADAGDPVYAFKPTVAGAPFVFRLMTEGLEWGRGRYSGTVPYTDIARLRMSYRPVAMQRSRFQLEIWAPGAPRLLVASATLRGFVEVQSQAADYLAFVSDLHRRIAAAGGSPRCETGIWPPLYWAGASVCAVVAAGLLVLVVRALQGEFWAGAAFIVAFLGFFAWEAGNFLRRNRPGTYRLDGLPKIVMPS